MDGGVANSGHVWRREESGGDVAPDGALFARCRYVGQRRRFSLLETGSFATMTPVRVLFLLLLLLGGGVTAACGQVPIQETPAAVPDSVVERVVTAFADGEAEPLLTPATDRVEVSLFGARTFYSRAQAFYVLREFFDAHPPADFQLSDITATEHSCFVQGQYAHDGGDISLQVYVRLAARDETWRLQEVRIDEGVE